MPEQPAPEPLPFPDVPPVEKAEPELGEAASFHSDRREEPFDYAVDEEPRRSRLPLMPLLLALLLVAAAALYFLAPASWRTAIGMGEPEETPLLLQVRNSDRQQLASGNELFAVSGRVINPTRKEQPVPPLRAELRDGRGRLIYSWTIAPPAKVLPPGASASFNSAEVNVPEGAERLTVTLGPPAA